MAHRFKGCGCPIFCDISQKTYKSINTAKDLNYYILIRCDRDSNNFSAPILINKPIIRMAFGITLQDTNVNIHHTSKRKIFGELIIYLSTKKPYLTNSFYLFNFFFRKKTIFLSFQTSIKYVLL